MVLIPIPYGLSYRATAKGRIAKVVQCEKCNQVYVYWLESTAVGSGFSPLFVDNAGAQERAQTGAHAGLLQALVTQCAVVPCIACGHVQQHMMGEAVRSYQKWMKTAALFSFCAGGILVLPATITTALANGPHASEMTALVGRTLWCGVGLLLGCAVGLPVLRWLLASRYDPNSLPLDYRKHWADSLAVSKEEFDKMIEEERQAESRTWRCFKCHKEVPYQEFQCPHCGYRLEVGRL
jgi:hypothetical protein